jgi:hypothetical protein
MLGPGEWTFDTDAETATCSKVCSVTDEEYTVTVELEQYMDWKGGNYIQNAMPELNADDREFLISGMTPAMWDNLYSETGE